jgi:DNA-binding NtrC family response regulator
MRRRWIVKGPLPNASRVLPSASRARRSCGAQCILSTDASLVHGMTAAPLVLAVTAGVDVGARLVLDATPKLVGRSRSSDLVLSDRGVSRAHVEVSTTDRGALFRCLPGTAPMMVRGVSMPEVVVPVGGSIVLADTVLSIAGASGEVVADTEDRTGQATTLRGLLRGLAADVKSLRSIAELVDALDLEGEEQGVARALETWGMASADARAVRLVIGEELRGDPMLARIAHSGSAVVALARKDGGADIVATAHGMTPAALIVSLDVRTDDIGEELLRLVGVAGRITGSALARIASQRVLEEDVASMRTLALGSSRAFLGSSPAAAEVARLVTRLAASDATALVLGESGTGKTFVARLIHEASPRAKEPFRVINCAAIPENLLESELFGHERGAFSGAVAAHVGAFEAVGRGTILLDEIGELPLASQAKLLRVLEERRFERVGSNKSLLMEARVLAATNRDLAAMVQGGQFRHDLFYRVSVVSIRVPALRGRGDDVIVLAKQMLTDLGANAGRRVTGFSAAALGVVRAYAWPGNVRELRNAIEHALVLGDGPIVEPGDLPEMVRNAGVAPRVSSGDVVQLPARLDWLEERAIEAALRSTGGNRTKAAAVLGINRVTLYKKLKEEPEG